MKRQRLLVTVPICVLVFVLQAVPFRAASPDKRPIELADIMAWRGIGATSLSDDGEWFGYRISPVEGDGDVVIRQTRGEKQYTFAGGETPAPAPQAPGGPPPEAPAVAGATVMFSSDARFAAFTIQPSRQEALALRKQRRPLQNKVGIVNLATGEKIEVPKVRRFAFSGEHGGWIAMHRYGPDAPGGGGAGAAGGAPGGAGSGGSTPPRDDRPRGTDLLLRELATGQEINIGNVAEFAFDKKGRFLAWTIDAQDKAGNGIYLRDMTSGAVRSLDTDSQAVYSRLSWTEEGDGLAVLKGADDKAYEDKLYRLVAFKDFGPNGPQKIVFNPGDASNFPEGMTISPNRTPAWTKGLDAVLFGIHKVRKKEAPVADEQAGTPGRAGAGSGDGETPEDERVNLVIWHWKDPRLQSMQQVQENRDKTFSYLSMYRPAEKRFIRLADDEVRDVTPAPEDRFAIGRNDDPYELMGNLDGRRYADIYVFDLQTGARKLAVKKSRWSYPPSPAGTHFLYYEDGHFYTYDMATGQSVNITKDVPASFINTEDDHNIVKPPTPTAGWSRDGKYVFLSDNWDIWQIPVGGGGGTNITVDGRTEQIRYRGLVSPDPEVRGLDLAKPIYLSAYGEWTKKAGIGMIEPGKPGVKRLMWDDASYRTPIRAKKAEVYLYTRETFADPPDYYVAGPSLADARKLTNLAAGTEAFLWSSGSILVDYVSMKGDKLQGTLHLPANYERGKSYPTIVYFYERMSQTRNQYARPTANGFNKSVYTSHGYAVFNPDIKYRVNDPGMSAYWCLVPAVKAAIATGVVDPKRVGIHGHSWGGYQTAFVITQTDLFAAAVAGAPLTNMISMYAIIYKNTGGTNGAIFESSQGRFTSGPWDNWEAYSRNSPVFHAKNVKTPLLILHNDRDGAVDFTQGIEYYNTLRRLQKPVVLLEYPGENHGLARRPNQKDYTVRMKEFFDAHLMGKPAPAWWVEGVPRLEMQEHLKSRQPARPKPVPATEGSKSGR